MSYPLPTMQAPRGEMSPALAATLGQELVPSMTEEERAAFFARQAIGYAPTHAAQQRAAWTSGLVATGGIVALVWWFWRRRR